MSVSCQNVKSGPPVDHFVNLEWLRKPYVLVEILDVKIRKLFLGSKGLLLFFFLVMVFLFYKFANICHVIEQPGVKVLIE